MIATKTPPAQAADLFDAHYLGLVRMCGLLLGDQESAEEVVQDAFVKLMTTDKPPTPGKEPQWLRSVALNGARSRGRHRSLVRRLRPGPSPDAPSAEHDAAAMAARRQMIERLRELPNRQREVVVLRYYLDLSEAEIAQTLSISQGSVKTHASRALTALRADSEQP